MNENHKRRHEVNYHDVTNAMLADLISTINQTRMGEFLEAMTRCLSIALASVDSKADMLSVIDTIAEELKEQASAAHDKLRAEDYDMQKLIIVPKNIVETPH